MDSNAFSSDAKNYYQDEPELFFAQMEAKFREKEINSQEAKFSKAISKLPHSIAMEVKDIIFHPPQIDPFNALKAAVIERTSLSKQERIKHLLHREHLGDRKPTQLLRAMRSLVDINYSDSLLKQIFLERLPAYILPMLAMSEDQNIDSLAQKADRIIEASAYSSPQVAMVASQPDQLVYGVNSSVRSPPHSEEADARLKKCEEKNSQLEAKIDNLTEKIGDLVNLLAQKNQPPTYRPRRPVRNGFCQYHSKFGTRAFRCVAPCSFNTNQKN